MRFVYFDDFAPYSWKTDGRMEGIFIELVNTVIAEGMGIAVHHAGYPWERAQRMVEAGQADAFITVPTPKRRAYCDISKAALTIFSLSPFTHKNNPRMDALKRIETIQDLSEFSIVTYTGNGWAKSRLAGMNIFWTPTRDNALFLLFKNKYDLFVGAPKTVAFVLKRLGYEGDIIQLPAVLETTPFNLCVGKQSAHRHILPDFDAAIEAMRASGRLQAITDRY